MLETVAIKWWLAALAAVSVLLLPHAFDDPFARVATSHTSFLCAPQ